MPNGTQSIEAVTVFDQNQTFSLHRHVLNFKHCSIMQNLYLVYIVPFTTTTLKTNLGKSFTKFSKKYVYIHYVVSININYKFKKIIYTNVQKVIAKKSRNVVRRRPHGRSLW